jgi:hypothetical protein
MFYVIVPVAFLTCLDCLVEHVQHAAQLPAAGADGHLDQGKGTDEGLQELRGAQYTHKIIGFRPSFGQM